VRFHFSGFRHISTSGLGTSAHPICDLALLAGGRTNFVRSADSFLCDLGVSFASEIRLAVLKTGSSLFAAKRQEIWETKGSGGRRFDFRHDHHISTSGFGSSSHPRRHLLHWRPHILRTLSRPLSKRFGRQFCLRNSTSAFEHRK